MFKPLALSVLMTSFMTACIGTFGSDSLRQAEELLREERYEEALAGYRAHMDRRLAVPDRPEWENPYFYLLLIGDIHLRLDDPETALKTYKDAESKGVHTALVSDRIRGAARWFEERNDLKRAIALLEQYRYLDPLLFDATLDRLARTLTRADDSHLAPHPATEAPHQNR